MACATAYAASQTKELTTVGRFAANDGSFFERISDPEKTFTAKTYDRIVGWFSDQWPDGTPWHDGVPRPLRHPRERRHERACADADAGRAGLRDRRS